MIHNSITLMLCRRGGPHYLVTCAVEMELTTLLLASVLDDKYKMIRFDLHEKDRAYCQLVLHTIL